MTEDKHRDWIPYAVAGAAAIVTVGLWLFGLWPDEHPGASRPIPYKHYTPADRKILI
jgi:hypothetical protein